MTESVAGVDVPESIAKPFQEAVEKATSKLAKYIHEDKATAYRYIRVAISVLVAAGAIVLAAVWNDDVSKDIVSKLFKAALAIWESE